MSEEYTPFPVSFMLAVGEAREAGAMAERERIIALVKKDVEMFSQCPHAPEDCPHCFHAKSYIENFFDRHPELIKGGVK